MSNRWAVLAILLLLYLPVSVDATVLHVATPRLTVGLGASGNEVLWIIDIYALVMAGLLLPMGALGDRIGFKRLAMIGSALFGLASLGAALAPSALALIGARVVLAIGAAMILPATVAGIRVNFDDDRERNLALGLWAAVGAAGAAFGPLIGGLLLEYFYWGSVFLINLPIVAIVLVAMKLLVADQPPRQAQPWKLGEALVLLTAILILVYAVKDGIRGAIDPLPTLGITVLGGGLLFACARRQLRSARPMIDLRLLARRAILAGMVLNVTTMIALVGFELLMSQELQFVHNRSPLEAGLFMLPLMVAAGAAGPFAGWIVGQLGARHVATIGAALGSAGFAALAVTDFATAPAAAMVWMTVLGLSIGSAQMISTVVVVSAAPAERAGAAGSMDGMAFELGAGLGVALMGTLLTSAYAASVLLPAGLDANTATRAGASIGEAMQAANLQEGPLAEAVREAARAAYISAHKIVLWTAAGILAAVTLLVWIAIPRGVGVAGDQRTNRTRSKA
jgi:MFS transporter, DHA2 family, multidrug resistance protein